MSLFLSAALPARHGFFGREGGVSSGAYASLNCSFSGTDEAANVLENRARVAAAMAVAPANLLGVKQVHGIEVVTAQAAWKPGDGPPADAIVTRRPGLALGVITADCAPVLFADAAGAVIGAAHAGWRGALAGVLEATVAAMRAQGADGVKAAIGPCIQPASYEVSAALRDPMLARNADDARFFKAGRPGHWWFDLAGYGAARLAAIGVPTQILRQDTCAQEHKYFSHRRRVLRGEGAIGHQISVIRL